MAPLPTSAPALAILAVAIAASPAAAGDFPARSEGRPLFVADVVVSPAAAGSVQVQVSWEIPYPQLTFEREEDWHRARYDVSVVVLQNGKQVAGDVWLRRARTRRAAETRDPKKIAMGRKLMGLRLGRYRVRIGVTDRVSKSRSVVEGVVEATFSRTAIALGNLEFIRYVDGVATRNPAREVQHDEEGHVLRVTLQPTSGASGNVQLRWKVRGPGRHTLFEADTTVAVRGGPLVTELPVRTDHLEVGLHQLEVVAVGPREETDRRTTRLHVRLSPRWFETRREEALEVLEQVADGDEWTELRGAEGAEWTERLSEFFARHDPSPGTEHNEYRESILLRMETAATLFVEPYRRPGWRTDRGRVMLRFGEPVRRSRQPGTFDHPASELWEYESPRRTFLFVDERGSGEFWLRS